MTQRTETLATAFEQAAGDFLMAVTELSDAAAGATPAGEARTASQIAYHMAEVYQNISGIIQRALAGQPLPNLTMDDMHNSNAERAAHYAGAGRERALEMLRQNGAATAALLRSLSDAQLDISIVFLGYHLTVESLAQNALVGHANEHLASIQAAATLA